MPKKNADTTNVTVRRKSTQRQLNMSHADVLRLLTVAGQPHPTKDEPLRLGSPAKGERPYLILHCVTAKGEEYDLIQGDTHAIWCSPKHQPEGSVGAEKLRKLVDGMAKGQAALIRVARVTFVPAGATASEADEEVQEVE